MGWRGEVTGGKGVHSEGGGMKKKGLSRMRIRDRQLERKRE